MNVRPFFDAEAARYDAAYESDDWAGRFLRARLEAALRALGSGPGFVLDVGMGTGRLCSVTLPTPSSTAVRIVRSAISPAWQTHRPQAAPRCR